ncbi:hypothetical protein LCGC14_3133880, partial [marine sediment metagenome]
NCKNQDQRKKLRQWFDMAVQPAVDPDRGDIIVIGTIIHMFSLLKNLLDPEEYPEWTTRLWSAIKKDGTPLWEALFNLVKLAKIKKRIGSHAFAKEYMNNPVDDELALFKQDWIKYYDRLPHYEDDAGETIEWDFRIGIDPAVSKKDSADYFAMITMGRDPVTKNLYVMDVYRKRASVEHHAASLIDLYLRYTPSKVTVETIAFQQVLKEALEKAAKAKGIYLPTKGIKPHKDKRLRIGKLQAPFERGEIYFRRDQKELIEEYSLYPSVDHEDVLDAMEICVDSFKSTDFLGIV